MNKRILAKPLAIALSATTFLSFAPVGNFTAMAASAQKVASIKKVSTTADKYTVKVGKTKTLKAKITFEKAVSKAEAKKSIKVSTSKKSAVAITKKAYSLNKKKTVCTVKVTVKAKAKGAANIKVKAAKGAAAAKKGVTWKVTAKEDETPTPTPEPEVEELGIKSVESADSNGYYVNVTFVNKLKTLSVADIDIRDASTKELFTVESVTLSSDGYTASIAMKGASTQGYASSALNEGVEYTLTISQNGKVAAANFEVAKVRANATINGFDKAKKQINLSEAWSARAGAITANAIGAVTLSDEVASTFDYEDMLGRTVTIWMDSANKVTKIEPLATQTVVYDYVTAIQNNAGKDIITGTDGKVYSLEATATTNQSTKPAVEIDLGNLYTETDAATAITPTERKLIFAKLVLNSDGNVQSVVYSDAATTVYRVDAMNGNTLSCGGTNISLKNFTIMKNGKGISTADLAAGDIVVVYAADHFAEVYSNSVTGVPSASYSDRFTLEGKSYKFIDGANQLTVYADKTDGQIAVTANKMKDIVDSKANVTVYFDRKGDARFLVVNDEEKSSTSDLVVTTTGTGYAVGDKHYINFKAFDGTSISNYEIICENLTKVTFADGTVFKPTNTTPLQYYASTGTAGSGWGATSAGTYALENNDATKEAVLNAVLAAGNFVQVTKNEAGVVTGLTVTAGNNIDAGATNFALGNAAVGTVVAGDAIYDSTKTSVTISDVSYTISATTPVYKLTTAGPGYVATKTTYAEAKGVIKDDATTNQVAYYVDGARNTVTNIVIYPGQLASETTTVRGLMTDYVLNSDSTKLVSFTAITAEGKKDYTVTPAIASVRNGSSTTYAIDLSTDVDIASGLVFDFEIDASGAAAGISTKTASVNDGIVDTMDGTGKITLTNTNTYTKASSTTPIYVKCTETGYSVIDPTEIEAGDYVDIYTIGSGSTSTNYDLVVRDDVAKHTATLAASAVAAIADANTAYLALNGTTAKMTAYVEADAIADGAIAAYVAAGGVANATNLTGEYTTFNANAAEAASIRTLQGTTIGATVEDSSTMASKAAVDAAVNVLVNTHEAWVTSAKYTTVSANASVVVTITFKDGSTSVVTYSSVTDTTGITQGDSITIS